MKKYWLVMVFFTFLVILAGYSFLNDSLSLGIAIPGSINSQPLTSDQLDAYSQCDQPTPNEVKEKGSITYTCRVGQMIGDYHLAVSVNSDKSIAVYWYPVPPAHVVNETFKPETVEYIQDQTIFDLCGRRTVLSDANYSKQTFTLTEMIDGSPCTPEV